MNAIVQFENHMNVATSFRQRQLEPRLQKAKILDVTTIIFQSYVNRLAPGAPVLRADAAARQAVEQWEQQAPEAVKTVFILDLDPTGASTPDTSYGFCVLVALAERIGVSIEQLLERPCFLVAVLSLYMGSLSDDRGIAQLLQPRCDLAVLDALWPRTRKIMDGSPARLTPEETARSLAATREPGPRIILANAGNDNAWLAELVARWLA